MVPVLHKHLTPVGLVTAQGFAFSFSELRYASLVFLFVIPKLSIPNLIGFGAAAGIIEVIILPLMSIGGINLFSGTQLRTTPLISGRIEAPHRSLSRSFPL